MKELKDYLMLYIGAKLERGGTVTHALLDAADKSSFNAYTDFKPILWPLSSMTDEQIKDLIKYEKCISQYEYVKFERIWFNNILTGIRIDYGIMEADGVYHRCWDLEFSAMNADDFAWCLKNHFDIFQLIESGLALDATEIKS